MKDQSEQGIEAAIKELEEAIKKTDVNPPSWMITSPDVYKQLEEYFDKHQNISHQSHKQELFAKFIDEDIEHKHVGYEGIALSKSSPMWSSIQEGSKHHKDPEAYLDWHIKTEHGKMMKELIPGEQSEFWFSRKRLVRSRLQ